MTATRTISLGRQAAFTLLEMVLALAVVVALAAILWPNLQSMPETGRLARLADDIRGLLSGLRVRAMDEGVVYRFEYQVETGQYRVLRPEQSAATNVDVTQQPSAPRDQNDSSNTEDPLERGVSEFDADDPVALGTQALPGGVLFRLQPTQYLESAPDDANADATAWPGITFRPDGTASDKTFWLVDGDRKVVFVMEGLTGTLRVTRPGPLADED